MSKLNTSQTLQTSKAASTNASSGILQRKCACGTHTIAGDKCEDCKNKDGILQRKASNNSVHSGAAPIGHEVLHSSGHLLSVASRASVRPRLGHDFSQIPVHTETPVKLQAKFTVNTPGDIYETAAPPAFDENQKVKIA